MGLTPEKHIRINMTKQIPLRLILVVPFVIQICLAVGLTGYFSLRNGEKAINDVASQLREETSNRIRQQVLVFLDRHYVVNHTIAIAIAEEHIKLTDLQVLQQLFWRLIQQNTTDYLQIGTPQGTSLGVERLQNKKIVSRIGEAANLPNRRIQELDDQGKPSQLLKIQKFDPRNRPWYLAPIKANQPVWSDLYISASFNFSSVAISLSEPIYSKTGKFLGVQNALFRIEKIHEFLKNLKIGRTGQTFIIDRSGNLIVSSVIERPYLIKDQKLTLIPAIKAENPIIHSTAQTVLQKFGDFRNVQGNEQINFSLNGQQQFVQLSVIQDTRGIDWLSVVVIPESDFMAAIQANTRLTIFLCLIALIVAIVLGIYTSQWITQPILHLIQASEAIANGALNQTVEPANVKEMGVLAQVFNKMAQQLRESFTALEQTNEQLEQRVEERTSQLRETLEQLQYSQSQMIQSEKMASLGLLMAGIAHEINNPVNFISGNVIHIKEYTQNLLELVELYQQEFPGDNVAIEDKVADIDLQFLKEDIIKLLSSMEIGTERIQEIVKSLRTFSRLDQLQTQGIDIHEGIESTLLILQHRLKANSDDSAIKLIKEYGNIPLISCYPAQLNQVFLNILVNAIDAIEEFNHNQTDPKIKNHTSCITISTTVINSKWVEVSIADNGPGMPESVQKQIFNPFFTTKPIGKGTGMGMAISHQIITEKHNGEISCFSTPGVGTKFSIRIPIKSF
ncbi:ATP-binding protein [Cronbergia sp. UHCC 0137]|uniref:sensor histidine kinase n=1 Tax=Cronbergia sp. UHCC 0137 TaxID=3110239 RepID=UPI002B1FAE26|nr:ATP-binding protein [Cronbergia sp. UHCC 0137]MEA5619386.1 ATP-binding protein [Cronbergia sp. UHCC 0137]